MRPGAPPASTCEGAFIAHKVSSTFPSDGFAQRGIDAIMSYRAEWKPEIYARRYLSLHCLGGAIKGDKATRDRSCFPYRDKPFMLQYQAWWTSDTPDKELEPRCIQWVRDFRKKLDGCAEGAFINFPDMDLVPDPDTPEGRKKLLGYYYGPNLADLIAVKRKFDPDNIFRFGMSIPTS